MTSISSPLPFSTQGIDIVGPLPRGKKQNFVQKNIVCRFGIPRRIISDNGRQFDSRRFSEFCVELGIKNHYSSPGHPQANGQTKVTNRTLLKCDKCQRFENVQHIPGELMTSISSPWPFSTQGIDIVGPLPRGKKQNFIQKNIVCRFGIPRRIISNNGRQFDSQRFSEFCAELGIKNHYSSPGHPQANGQTKVTNHTLLKLIKARLEGAKSAWPEKLLGVLWAYRTTAGTPIGETPFKLAFGTEAVIPIEMGLSSLKQAHYHESLNNDELRLNLDCLSEV